MKAILIFILAASTGAGTFAQKAAHNATIQEIAADGRGEVAVSIDVNEIAKIWSLADGKIVATMKYGTPEWYSKHLRYRIDYGSLPDIYKIDVENVYRKDSTVFIINSDGSKVGRIGFAVSASTSHDQNVVNKKILFAAHDNGKSTIWICDPSLESRKQNNLLDSYKSGYIYPDWSPKGNYVMCTESRRLWDINTGKMRKFPDELLPVGQMLNSCFSVTEDKVSIVTKDGIAVMETATGKLLALYTTPAEIKGDKYTIVPCSDGKSFIYRHGERFGTKDKNDPKFRRAWIVTEGKILTELVD